VIDHQIACSEREAIADVEHGVAVGDDVAGEVLAGVQGDVGIAVDQGDLAVGVAVGRSDLHTVGAGQDVFEGVEANPHRALVAAAAEAIDAVRGAPRVGAK
jgi:hypothetical protein